MNKQDVKKFYKLDEELQVLLDKESDAYKKAKENGENKIEIPNRNPIDKTDENGQIIEEAPKTVEVKENWLWEEVFHQGLDPEKVEAVKILEEKYPEVFEYARKRQDKNEELNNHLIATFGFDLREMTPSRIIKLVDALIEFRMEKYYGNTK